MRIQHNIAAMNSHRQLGVNNGMVAKNLEKLSSGFRINRAGDDAAGLAISEKMRSQIKGLETAQKNAADGISLIQTAEGALTEVHSMLNRMVELATQASNGTYSDKDREKLQAEVSSLREEIDRIGDGTNFNGIDLLNGKLGAGSGVVANWTKSHTKMKFAAAGITITKVGGVNLAGAGANAKISAKALTGTGNAGKVSVTYVDKDGNGTTKVINLNDLVKKADGSAWTPAAKRENGVLDLTSVGLGVIEFTSGTTSAATGANLATGLVAAIGGSGAAVAAGTSAASGSLSLQVGDTNKSFQKVKVSIASMKAGALGLSPINIGTEKGAGDAIQIINDAIGKVSGTRSDLGAVQNRLEHTINNLGVTTENLSAAEARIRDVDMADEMMKFTKNNILTQAAQAMLAQANQVPQGVLQLLR